MNQWLNNSHPRTLQAGVFLGYLSAVFTLLGGGALGIPIAIAVGVGAFATANDKRWGYVMLAAGSSILALLFIYVLLSGIFEGSQIKDLLGSLNNAVFPVALAAAVLHTQSREYQKVWFQ